VTSPLLLQLQAVSANPLSQLYASVPPWMWGWVVATCVLFVIALGYAILRLHKMRGFCVAHVAALEKVGVLTDEVRLQGQPLSAVDRWREAVKKIPPAARFLGEDIERRLVAVRTQPQEPRYRLLDGDGPIWTVEELGGRFLNVAFIDAVPGLLTAWGLVGTFAAIAYGLGGLSELDSGAIAGVGGLLGGLGGKFITSIAALLLAFVFQLIDVIALRRSLAGSHALVMDAVARAFPKQTAAQQVADLLESARKQEAALANISSDMVTAFGDLFTSNLLPDLGRLLASSVEEQLGPVMAEVATGIRSLDQGIKRLESGKQESLSEELKSLTGNLERSVTAALERMGSNFQQSLSGSAGREFEQAAAAMRDSAEVLRSMNESFDTMQGALQRLLTDAEARTARTFEENEGRTKALNDLVERLVSQLNEQASTSAGEVQRLLVQAVSGVGATLTDLTSELQRRFTEAADEQARTTGEVLTEASQAAGRTTIETERVLAKLAERSTDFVAAADQLRELREGVSQVLSQTGNRVRELNDAASAFRTVATEANSITKALRESQDQHRRAAETAAGMVNRVGEVAATQVQAADKARVAFEAADRIMDELDTQLERTLQVIVNRMQDYNTQVERNFEKILGSVNQKMPELFTRLEGALQQLNLAVEELTDAVGKPKPAQGAR
jgi:ABC-type transporter Mla subunit MlaD